MLTLKRLGTVSIRCVLLNASAREEDAVLATDFSIPPMLPRHNQVFIAS